MTSFTIDCAGIKHPAQLWQRYIDVVSPIGAEHFGRNLDAFWDAAQHGGPGDPGEGSVIVFANSSILEDLRTVGGTSFLDALKLLATDTDRVAIKLS